MMIEDEELRSLYHTTSVDRIRALETGLLTSQVSLEGEQLERLRREAHSLKGDSRVVGLEEIALLAQQVEQVIKHLQRQEINWTEALHEPLASTLQAIDQLVQCATLGTPVEVHTEHLNQPLRDALAEVGITTSETTEILQPPANFIPDAEMREIYRISSEGRLQKLRQALEQLITNPQDEIVLETIRYEAHSFKGDSLVVGLDTVGNFMQQFEAVIKSLMAQTIDLVPSLYERLQQGLGLAEELVKEAVIGISSGVDLDILNSLLADFNNIPTPSSTPSPLSEDLELRQLFQMTSQQRLEELEKVLSQLEQEPENTDLVAQLRQEIHRFKGDAKVAQVEPVESLTHVLEDIFESLQQQTIELTPALRQCLHQSFEAMQTLVLATVTDTASAIDVTEVINNLIAASESELVSESPAPEITDDRELRKIYKLTSNERLQRLEASLVQLETQADHGTILAELLREVHSLKGDSRSIGLNRVEGLAHAMEDILSGIQRQEIAPNPELTDNLYRGLDAISQLIEESFNSTTTTTLNSEQLLEELQEMAVPVNPATITLPPIDAQPEAPSTISESDRLDTIRVSTQDLDILASQTEQLTVTRIQTNQIATQVERMANLWAELRTYQSGQLQPGEDDNPYAKELEHIINTLMLSTQENSSKLDVISQELGERVQNMRLLPLSNVFRLFPRVVRDLARQQSKSVELITEGGDTTTDKGILEEIKDSLMHLIRNALDHGIETPAEREAAGKSGTAKLWLRGYQTANTLVIEVADDGRGLDTEQIKQTAVQRRLYSREEVDKLAPSQVQDLIFTPGFSTRNFITEISGRGVGLDVVRTQVERLQGNINIDSNPGKGCTFRLQIRTRLTTANVVFVGVRGITHALPIESLQTTMRISDKDIVTVDGRNTITWNEQVVPIADLFDVLELANSPSYQPSIDNPSLIQKACLLLKVGDEIAGLLVDQLLNTQEVVLKPQTSLLRRVRNVTGATILANGAVCTILNPPDLLKSIQRFGSTTAAIPSPQKVKQRKPLILLVEDSPPVRIQEKRLFESAGYEVVTAKNGLEGYEILRNKTFDAVVSDVEMPKLDGLSLTARIRQHSEYDELPVVLVTTLSSDSDRKRGANAGANAYIVKGKFNQEVLLETLQRLI